MNSFLENRIPPPFLAFAIGLAMGAAKPVSSSELLSAVTKETLTMGFCITAGLFGLPAFVKFDEARTTISPTQIERASTLVTTGIYRITRNPMYVALTLLLCGWASWLAQPLAITGPLAFALYLNRFQIAPEERALLAKFGQAYSDYQRSVRRWL